MFKKICAACGRHFFAQTNIQKYCSLECFDAHQFTSKTVLNVEPIEISVPAIDDKKKIVLTVPELVEKTCATCGKVFKTRQLHQKYCSPECRTKGNNDMQNARRAAPHPEVACIVCGKVFKQKTKRGKFCSRKCQIKYNNAKCAEKRTANKPEVTCPVCGKIFKQKRRTQKFCSDKCQGKQKYADWREKLGKQKPKKKICLICGQEFTPHRNTQKYCQECGKAMYPTWKKSQGKEEYNCLNCGEHIFGFPSQQKLFCSQQCYHEYQRKQRGMPPLSKPEEKKKCSACETITLTCEICGKDFTANYGGARAKYCSDECRRLAANQHRRALETKTNYRKEKPRDPKRKTIEQWQAEAQQCGMSYGIYRMNIEKLGKTFEELKLK